MRNTWAQFIIHAAHCTGYIACVLATYWILEAPGFVDGGSLDSSESEFSPGFSFVLFTLKLLPLLATPRLVMNIAGLLFYDKCYLKEVQLNGKPLFSPFICFRVVTRGNFPSLVKQNVERNLRTCLKVGMEDFVVEVVTDKPVCCPPNMYVRETVVPANYKTRSGAKYKARALQYCLEDGVNVLEDHDWIVHLDEESLLTENSVRGILNFVHAGQYPFGQGIITYNHAIVNEITTLMDALRVADDLGTVRGQFKMFHKPLFGWKGSYCVCQFAAEKHVSFDHGWAGSIAEDLYFCLVAYKYGYSFDYVEGEIVEKSPFSHLDFLRQRKRWFEGQLLVIMSIAIPIRIKIFAIFSILASALSPLILVNVLLELTTSSSHWFLLDLHHSFMTGSLIFIYACGVIKSHTLHPQRGLAVLCLQLAAIVVVGPLTFIYQFVVPIWSFWSNRIEFYVVEKEILERKKTKVISFVQ